MKYSVIIPSIIAFLLSYSVAYADMELAAQLLEDGDEQAAIAAAMEDADGGNADAQFFIGEIYFFENSPADQIEAFKWFKKAADANHIGAISRVGQAYYNGHAVLQNFQEAFNWLSRAADQKDATSQRFLGLMYTQGKGTTPDIILAHMWHNLASAHGEIDSSDDRDSLESIMTGEQRARARNMAIEWMINHQ